MPKDNGELEIELNPEFNRSFWKVQRVGWILLALVACAAIAGLFGPGLAGPKTVRDSETGMSLTYERLVRNQSPVELQIQLSVSDAKARLAFNRDFIEGIEIQKIIPEPQAEESVGQDFIYTFRRTSSLPMKVLFRFEPKRFGPMPVRIRLNENSPMTISQFSYP